MSPTSSALDFEDHKYLVLRSLLNPAQSRSYYEYALKRATSGTMTLGDPQVPETPNAYGDPVMETLLEAMVPQVEQASGRRVWPTYAYFRVYKCGDTLRRHKDRPSCELSLSVSLGYQAARPWPLWVEGPHGVSRIELHPGDALLYRGMDCFHWRDAFDGDHGAQVFLHYVDQDGPNAEWKFDKRERLNSLRNRGSR